MGEEERRWRLQALGALALLAPFNLVGRRSGGWLLLPLVVVSLALGALLMAWALIAALDDAPSGSPGRPARDVASLLGLATLAAIWISVAFADDRWTSAGAACRMCVPVVLAIAVANTVVEEADVAFLLGRSVAATLVGVAIGAIVWMVGDEIAGTSRFFGGITRLGPYDRLTRPWSHANVAAMAIGATAFGAVALRSRRHATVAAVVLVLAMVATYSRGGAVALAGGGVAWLLVRRERRPVTSAPAGLLAIAVVAAIALPGWLDRTSGSDQLDFFGADVAAPAEVRLGDRPVALDVEVVNRSSVSWSSGGEEPVLLSARWVEPDSSIVRAEHRWSLPEDIGPGASTSLDLELEPIVPDGRFDVWWDLLIVEEAYFRQFAGLEPTISAGIVEGSSVSATVEPSGAIVTPRRFLRRTDIFEAGVDAFLDEPVVGVGPGALAGTLAIEERVAHAHSLVLEPLATWGLLGAVPWLILFGGAVVRALRSGSANRESLIAGALAASMVVVAVHGLVDWPLVHVSIGIPLGLLIGASWSPATELVTDG